ncbi:MULTISPECIES: phage head closure protein [Pseudobacteroides]|uniref:Phage head-tail adaptor n=1 Tax=Pseudobacteroides cellulosolvens ATCC 35603 = DSM 2933 TaxID=398512 RepID=A0A0L6JT55_9FIRM|nr:phage head closure protein [Pseudobacteroides cellulosolvens]KNY29031.1 phage head-tail adaptor [Pseudobacteroides cellulosolvens ATCC 35603 = DSM 2933]
MAWRNNNQRRQYAGQGNMVKPLLSIGKLRHRITIQSYSTIKNSFGEEVKVWTDYAVVSASVEPMSGKELFTAQQLHAETTTQIILRYLGGLNTSMRVLFNNKIYDILHVSNKEERNIAIYLLCKENGEVV